MNKREHFAAVLAANKAQRQQARALNQRAGAIVFAILTQAELADWMRAAMSGARNIDEIPDVEALRLPELDAGTVARVFVDNPDQISLAGIGTVTVEYRGAEQVPRIRLGQEVLSDSGYRHLPDSGVVLPGGRAVEVTVQLSASHWETISATDIPVLKTKLGENLNTRAWNAWTARPAIPLPDSADETSAIAEVQEATYGTCAINNSPLIAYGGVEVNRGRYRESEPWFRGQWFRTRAEADGARTQAATKLEQLRSEARERRELEALRPEAEALQVRVAELYSGYGGRLGGDLDRRLSSCRWSLPPRTLAELRSWIGETLALVQQADLIVAHHRLLAELTTQLDQLAARLRTNPKGPPSDQMAGATLLAELRAQLATAPDAVQARMGDATAAVDRACTEKASTLADLVANWGPGSNRGARKDDPTKKKKK